MNLMVVKKLLRETKANVDTASSGAEALEKTLQTAYDVILMKPVRGKSLEDELARQVPKVMKS